MSSGSWTVYLEMSGMWQTKQSAAVWRQWGFILEEMRLNDKTTSHLLWGTAFLFSICVCEQNMQYLAIISDSPEVSWVKHFHWNNFVWIHLFQRNSIKMEGTSSWWHCFSFFSCLLHFQTCLHSGKVSPAAGVTTGEEDERRSFQNFLVSLYSVVDI